MGADLICYILKGPVKFRKSDIRKAEKHVEKVIIFAAKVYEAIKKSDAEGHLDPVEVNLLDKGLNNPLLVSFNDQEQYSNVFEAETLLEELAASSPETEVAKFVEWWTGNEGRDTAGRRDPDDNKQQIVVCGDRSSGDSPEGFGYTTTRRAYWFDIPNILGVR